MMRRVGNLNILIFAYQSYLLVQVLWFYDFPFWLAKFASYYPLKDVKTWCGSSRSISNELRNSVASGSQDKSRCDQHTFLAYCFLSEALAMNLHILRDRILRLWQVAGDSMGKSVLDKRRGGILWTVWNVVVSYLTEWLSVKYRPYGGSLRWVILL